MAEVIFIPHADTTAASDLRTAITAALPASGFVDLPGPAAGFVRFWNFVFAQPNVAASPLANLSLSLQPTNVPFQLAVAGGANGASSILGGGTPIGVGETLRVTNGSANAGTVSSQYIDRPTSQITLVRQQLMVAPTVVIPAPAAGLRRYWARVYPASFGSQLTHIGTVQMSNVDSVAAQFVFALGGVLLSRSASFAAAATPTAPGQVASVNVTSATGDLTAFLTAAPTTTSPWLLGAYETL